MKKWAWSLGIALTTWAVGLKFSPEDTIIGDFRQLRYEAASLLLGGFIGFMVGLVVTKSTCRAQELRKLLYSALACAAVGFVLTWGGFAYIGRTAIACLSGAAIGLAIAGVNYLWATRRAG